MYVGIAEPGVCVEPGKVFGKYAFTLHLLATFSLKPSEFIPPLD